jgi:hypothetical protein
MHLTAGKPARAARKIAGAAAAFGILYIFMPETRDKRFLNPTAGATTL